MRLSRIKIEGYKHLKDTIVEFRELDGCFGEAAIRFFIGLNGSGKSAFLEAIGLIFTRIMQDEVPGFYFELEYSIKIDGNEVRVFVYPIREKEKDRSLDMKAKLKVVTIDSAGYKETHNSYSNQKNLHPHRIIAYSSGPNSIMQDVLLLSPRKSLYSDIYDAGDMVVSSKTSSTREKEIGKSIEHIYNLDNSPRCIFIDGEMAKLVLAILCAVVPGSSGKNNFNEKKVNYCKLRNKLMDKISSPFEPIAFSLIVDEQKLDEIRRLKKGIIGPTNTHEMFLELIYSQKEAEGMKTLGLNDWVITRETFSAGEIKQQSSDKHDTKREIVAVFNFDGDSETEYYRVPRLDEKYKDPLHLLTILLKAKNDGLLKDVYFAFKNGNCNEVLDDKALSDGEFLWLARMGLVLMARQEETDNCLFLFDEPDVHLNESWVIDFVNLLHEFVDVGDAAANHEIIIATHSSLILTDAPYNQLYHFKNKNGNINVESGIISTFAADRDEITRRIFEPEKLGEKYSKKLIASAIEHGSIEELRKLISITGPGYDRFRLRDKLGELLQEPAQQEGKRH